jgi:two-component system chemotaxis response regulator CheY
MTEEAIKVPFGFVTSEASPDMQAAAFSAGAAFMIRKPFKPETFRHELQAVL